MATSLKSAVLAEHNERPSGAMGSVSLHFSGGLGVASACSTDAAEINICLFSLTPSNLVLKGAGQISRQQSKKQGMRGGACDVTRSTCITAPTEVENY